MDSGRSSLLVCAIIASFCLFHHPAQNTYNVLLVSTYIATTACIQGIKVNKKMKIFQLEKDFQEHSHP